MTSRTLERAAGRVFRPLAAGVFASVLLWKDPDHGHDIHPRLYAYTLTATAVLFGVWFLLGVGAARTEEYRP
jgi:hypothetical protein